MTAISWQDGRDYDTTAGIMADLFERSAAVAREVNAGKELTGDQFASAVSGAWAVLFDAVVREFNAAGRWDLSRKMTAQVTAEVLAAAREGALPDELVV